MINQKNHPLWVKDKIEIVSEHANIAYRVTGKVRRIVTDNISILVRNRRRIIQLIYRDLYSAFRQR